MRLKQMISIMMTAMVAVATSCSDSKDEPLKPLPELPGEKPEPQPQPEKSDNVVVAYVTSWSTCDVDPKHMTHINYAFGYVTENFSGVGVSNEDRLRYVAGLKKQAPDLKVLLSVGGWGSGRFSEMTADATFRKSFADDCRRVIDEFGIDGIDIDWEFPTTDAGGLISCSPDDTRNYTLMMRDIRESIGSDKLLTLATSVDAGYIDLGDIMPYVDFVNIMAYDMENAPRHHSCLYRSSLSGWITADEGVQKHLAKGVPAEKLVLGIPFYGHGRAPYDQTVNFADIRVLDGCSEKWDNNAEAPYMANSKGEMVLGFDNVKSIKIKCDYIRDKGMLGAMYWDYALDDSRNTLRDAVATLMVK